MDIREVLDRDEEGIRELFAVCFNKTLSSEEWRWKYRAGPWGSAASVAIEQGEIIAHYGGIRLEFVSQDRTFRVFQSCDVMTHPRCRARALARRGAFACTGEHFFANNPMDFAFGFPSERHAILGTKLLGYTEHHHVTALEKDISSAGHGWKSLLGRALYTTAAGWETLRGVEVDVLWDRIKEGYPLSIRKDSPYLFWRYRDHPTRRYEVLQIRNRYSKGLRGLAICSIQDADLFLLDFLTRNVFELEYLLASVERLAAMRGVRRVVLWANPREVAYQVLIGSGFTPTRGMPCTFWIGNSTVTATFLAQNYCYRMGDYDAA